jgi:hypothetical protein
VQRALVFVEVFDELGNTALVVKIVRFLGLLAFVLYENANALIEERLFP